MVLKKEIDLTQQDEYISMPTAYIGFAELNTNLEYFSENYLNCKTVLTVLIL